MITILKKEIHSTTFHVEFKSKLKSKTLNTLSVVSTINMTANDKDFYGKYKDNYIM